MINFFHNQVPDPILLSIGPISIYWYGFCIILGIIVATGVAMKLAKYYKVSQDIIFDLMFYIMLNGIIGARIYHVFLELPYYLENPVNIFKIWNGGLAIHGGIIAGGLTLWVFAKKQKLNFWKLSALIVSSLPLAQAIGRWGNYFNNELFGLPTNVSWGIPVLPENKILEYSDFEFFHPTFLYESIGNLMIFIILILFNVWMIKKKKFTTVYFMLVTSSYLILYSLLRFSLEFVRIDITPSFGVLRVPQIASFIIILIVISFWIKYYRNIIKVNLNIKKGDDKNDRFACNKGSNDRNQKDCS